MIYYIKGTVKRELSINTPISRLFVSVYLPKILNSYGIHILDDILQLGKDVICQLGGLIDEDKEEISNLLDHLYSADGIKLISNTLETDDFLNKERMRMRIAGELCRGTTIGELKLPKKIINALSRAGITSIETLEETDSTELEQIHGLGLQACLQIEQALHVYMQDLLLSKKNSLLQQTPAGMCLCFLESLSKYAPVFKLKIYHETLPLFVAAHEDAREINLEHVYMTTTIQKIITKKLIHVINQNWFGVTFKTLRASVPEELLPSDVMHSILGELQRNERIEMSDTIRLKYPTAMERIREKVLDPRLYDILTQRIQGASLASLAEKHGVSMERIRQITMSWYYAKDALVHEDRYVEVFQKYFLKKNHFMFLFNETEETYNYLSMVVSKKGNMPISEICNDLSLPEDLRIIIRRKLSPNGMILVDGIEIEKQRTSIVDYLVSTKFREGGTIDLLVEAYREILKGNGLENDQNLSIDGKNTVEDELKYSPMVLYKQGRQFRYYDIWKQDYSQLLKELALEQYRDCNAEYSTKKFFFEHLQVMNVYDIRDEYELHNLLRNIKDKYGLTYITLKRMPILSFGEVKTEEQIQAFLQKHSPISRKEFFSLYEKTYGIKLFQQARVLTRFASFYDGRVYDLPQQTFQTIATDYNYEFGQMLTEDCYQLEDVKTMYAEKYAKEFPTDREWLSRLGYQINGGIMLSNRWGSSGEYYLYLLTAGDVVEINQIPRFIRTRKQFYDVLHRLEKKGQLVRYKENSYLTELGMKHHGLLPDDVIEFRESVKEVIPEDTCFTIAQLRQQKTALQFPGEDLNDIAYGFMLAGNPNLFSATALDGTLVLLHGRKDDPVKELIKKLVQVHGPLMVKELSDILKSDYELDVKTDTLMSKIKRSDLYLDKNSRTIYSSMDAYQQQIEVNG